MHTLPRELPILVALFFVPTVALGTSFPTPTVDGCERCGVTMNDLDRMAFEIPYEGSGKFVSLLSTGALTPKRNTGLFLSTSKSTNLIPTKAPRDARWRSSSELIVLTTAGWTDSGEAGRLSLVPLLDGEPRILAEWQRLYSPRVSAQGDHVAVTAYSTEREVGIEVRRLPDFDLVHRFEDKDIRSIVWAPDGKRLAVAYDRITDDGAVWPRLALLSLESGAIERIADAVPPRERELGGTTPLFWTKRGLFAYSERGVLQCDPRGNGCTLHYRPGHGRRIIAGTSVGDDEAYVLVRDVAEDPLEARAKEVHRVDLTAPGGRMLVRAPDGVFIEAIDWTRE